jgi:hypothetical protein
MDYHEEMNEKIKTRQFPDMPLEPNYDFRSVKTRYSLFPVLDMRMPLKEKATEYLDYHVEINFNPATRKAPCSGYFTNIDTENKLRGQTELLRRDYITENGLRMNENVAYSSHMDETCIRGFSNFVAGETRQPPQTQGIDVENGFHFSTRNQIR